MLRLSLIFLIILLAFFRANVVHAAKFSGAYLIEICASDKDGKELVKGGHIACQAYISGIIDYTTVLRSLGTQPSVDFCIPDNEALNVIHQHVFNFIVKNRSQHAQFIGSPAVVLALHNKYPCKK